MRYTGVNARGIISPIFKQGDDLVGGVCDCLLRAARNEGFDIQNGDILGVTESVVARTQGNYASCGQIAADIRAKFGGGDMGVLFPITSRNRFAVILKAIAMACEKLYIQLSYPSDEVGNALVPLELVDANGVSPHADSFDENGFRELFGGDTSHPFTGVDYIELYKSYGKNTELLFSNDPAYILNYTKNVLCCDIHTRARTKRIVRGRGGVNVYGLDDIMAASVDGSGYNPEFGLLGSNAATEDSVKLFPRNCGAVVDKIQKAIKDKTGKTVEVLIYGDGCFKDPIGGIWELADPVSAPAYTSGLGGTPSELKIKYYADNDFGALEGAALEDALRERIRCKGARLLGEAEALGTTPRRYADLLASLCDLVSGSGDKGTPIVYIKGYFSNFASE